MRFGLNAARCLLLGNVGMFSFAEESIMITKARKTGSCFSSVGRCSY